MQIKHANVTTPDVAGLVALFQRFFGFELVDKRGQDAFALMRDANGFVLTLMKPKKRDPDRYPEMFHLGFYCDNPDLVRAKHAELSGAGLCPSEVENVDRGGAVTTFYFRPAAADILIEVATPPGFVTEATSMSAA
jgi:catechol 2,3-dioxygenase-like lactoylglutathione lyase family enzyme